MKDDEIGECLAGNLTLVVALHVRRDHTDMV